ncbi:S-norcoclaurine synthase-like [Neltuma alba]|uniref:S-norcoclaurine synthase n=1 Tax=Neltuma alba TaxID=207710 RepID=UPI0010A3C1BD|nr:S-norcoclaurine synthase-like [Prosopis alba]XP_028753372.1 S-norcoclaurine synthase-like [Prosopis alba]
MAAGHLEHELELGVPASEAWDLFGTLRLGEFFEKEMPSLFQKVELVEGDGGIGTVLKLTFVPGTLGPTCYKEKFTKVDNENRIKEIEVIEGGYLELGFTLFRGRFHIMEKGKDSSTVKSTVEYELKQEASENGSIASNAIQALANIAQVAKQHLNRNKLADPPK